MTANPDLGIRFWTPSSVFVALPPLRQPAPPPAIRGDSVAALALVRAHRQGHHRQLPKHHLAFARANGVTQIVEKHEAEEARTKQRRDRMELIGEEQPCC